MTTTRDRPTPTPRPDDADRACGPSSRTGTARPTCSSCATSPARRPAAGEVLLEVHAAGLDRGVVAPDDRRALPGPAGRLRPRAGPSSRSWAWTSPAGWSPSARDVTRFRVGDEVFGHRHGHLRRVRRGPRGQAGPQARAAVLRPRRRSVADLRHAPRCRRCTDVAGSSRASGCWCSAPRAASAASPSSSPVALGAEVTGVASAAKAELVRAPRRRPGHRLRHRGLRRRRRALRPHHRHRRPQPDPPAAPGADADRHAGDRRRRGRNKITGGIGRQLRAALLSPFVRHDLGFFIQAESAEQIDRVLRPHRDRRRRADDVSHLRSGRGARRHGGPRRRRARRQGSHRRPLKPEHPLRTDRSEMRHD